MGELIGNAVPGTLYYVPEGEFARLRKLDADPHRVAGVFANLCRINALYMIARAGSGHIGSSFSSLDIVTWLLLRELKHNGDGRDLFFSSKGHDAPGYYAALIAVDRLPFDLVHKLRHIEGLPGHPDVSTPGIVTNTGSLGMGISKAKGLAMAKRLSGEGGRVIVMTGDGELQEGQIWESLIGAANNRFGEIVVIVDHNKLQSDTLVAKTSDLGDLDAKFASFGWHVQRIDGHDIAALAAALERCGEVSDQPHVIIADTVKGRGISFMEHTAFDSDTELYKYHSGAPQEGDYVSGVQELIDTANQGLRALGQGEVLLETDRAPGRAPATNALRLIPAYADALVELAGEDDRIVALDADLALDTGLLAFQAKFPERFIECGIAEMDMVSQAGGLALAGRLPVVHSFACFLATRPNEQIYNNATERTKIVYVGSLAGLVPAGPGHSHQSVRDIAALSGTPGLVMVEPSCPAEVAPLLRWCAHEHTHSSYMRLVSIPVEIPFELPQGYQPEPGRGVSLHAGEDAILFTYGPVMLSEAVKAAYKLQEQGIGLEVVNMPWLNRIDPQWLLRAVEGHRAVFTLDNHYVEGGQGQVIAAACAEQALGVPVHRIGVTEIPACGANDAVLRHHGLDADGLVASVLQYLSRS